jgi:hypothetical protein
VMTHPAAQTNRPVPDIRPYMQLGGGGVLKVEISHSCMLTSYCFKADADQTVSPKDALLFQIRADA